MKKTSDRPGNSFLRLLALWLGLILVGLIGVGGTLVWKAKKQR